MSVKVAWFKNSPSAGDPDCICSYCRQPIEAGEIPVRFWHDNDRDLEVRFHASCFNNIVLIVAAQEIGRQ